MTEYEITLANIFEAEDEIDALAQMVAYTSDQAYVAGYRVKNLETGESTFLDAERALR
jgi:hypothetical protein